MSTKLNEMKKPMLFMASFPNGDVRLVDVLGENKRIKNGIYIRYAEGGTDTTTERFLFEIPTQLQQSESAPIAVGDLVESIDKAQPLTSGCSLYECAVVVSIDPFILVSEKADMKWQATVSPERFRTIGKASVEQLELCSKRIYT